MSSDFALLVGSFKDTAEASLERALEMQLRCPDPRPPPPPHTQRKVAYSEILHSFSPGKCVSGCTMVHGSACFPGKRLTRNGAERYYGEASRFLKFSIGFRPGCAVSPH